MTLFFLVPPRRFISISSQGFARTPTNYIFLERGRAGTPDLLALPASLVRTYWPFGPVWSWCTGPPGQFGSYVLALRASLVMTYWPFGPVWSWCTGPPGQFGLALLAFRASLILMYWPSGPVWSWLTGPTGQFGPDLLNRFSIYIFYFEFRFRVLISTFDLDFRFLVSVSRMTLHP